MKNKWKSKQGHGATEREGIEFKNIREFNRYLKNIYREAKGKKWSSRKKLTIDQIIQLHIAYLRDTPSLKQLAKETKWRWNIDIDPSTIAKYFNKLEFIKYRSKKEKKRDKKKQIVSDKKIDDDCWVIDDSNLSKFPIRNKYRGNIEDYNMISIYDVKRDEHKHILINKNEKEKSRQIELVVKEIKKISNRDIAIDGELAKEGHEVFGSDQIKRYNTLSISTKEMSGNIPLSEYYGIGERQHQTKKEGVQNQVDFLKLFPTITKEDIDTKFEGFLLQTYEKQLDSFSSVVRWIKKAKK